MIMDYQNNPKDSRIHCRLLAIALLLLLFWGAGCGDFFAQKPTELQTKKILNELREIKESPHTKNPLPELYRTEPKRIKVKDGVKLFYFTKHHPVDMLSLLICQQFAKMNTDNNGNTIYAPDYAISVNPATNQLIIDCPTDKDIDKVLEFLEMVDVPPIQINVDCLILERFADITMDWETTIKIENFLGEELTLGGKTDDDGDLLAAFPGASLRETKRSTFGLDVGYWKNKGVTGHEFRAVVDILISRGYLKILLNPVLETINGQKAKISIRDFAPLEMIVTKEGVDPYSLTDYKWVEDTLEVTPHVYSDGSIGLATSITLGSKSKPEGVVQTSIITERSIEIAENRISPGDSLVIGGIRKTEERAVIRGVPFLKDLPLIGILFSSKDFEEKSTEVIFILTPSISSGGVEHAQVIEAIKEKYARPEYKAGLHEMLTDPFGGGIYTDYVEQEAVRAKFEKLKADLEKAEAIEEVDTLKEQLLKAADEVIAEREKVSVEHKKANEAQKQAAAAQKDAQKAKAEAEKIKAEAIKIKQQAEEAQRQAERKKEEAKEAETKPSPPETGTDGK